VKADRIPIKLVIGIIIALCFSIALFFRTFFPYDIVFSDGLIKFTGVDAYYFMRLVDNLVQNFPQPISFDPYLTYPGGQGIGTPPFFTWFLAGIIWLIGLGSPTEHTVDLVGVYFPAVLAALSVIPVYFIGQALFGRLAGLISAGLIAILPGEFLGRSILGFTDYHIAEMLFTTTAMMFLIMAIKTSQERGLTIDHLRRADWATANKPLIYSLLAGTLLGIYFITWTGALLFTFIIAIYLVIQSVINHLRHESTEYINLVGFTVFMVALAIYAPVWHKPLATVSLGIALLIPAGLTIISQLMTRRNIRPAYYPLALLGLGAVAVTTLYVAAPSMLRDMLAAFSIFTPSGLELTTLEMQPLLAPRGELTPGLGWGNFTTSFFLFPPSPSLPEWMHYLPGLGLIALGILTGIFIYQAIKTRNAPKSLLLLIVWSLVMLLAVLGQRRFAYYFAANIAILTGFLSGQIIVRTYYSTRYYGFPNSVKMTLVGSVALISIFIALFPNINPALAVATQARFAPTEGWVSSLTWLRENTPEPFGDPNAYYQLYQPPPRGEPYKYPESAYSVASWWDYGYWTLRIAHRIPHSNPGSDPKSRANTARLFLSADEESAKPIIEEIGAKYIIIDNLTTLNKLSAISQWAGMPREHYYDSYFIPQEDNRAARVLLYHPEYYRSLAVSLYNFDGQAFIPTETIVISYEEREEGKLITFAEVFDSYEEAAAFISNQESGDFRIVGRHPFNSPVPLAALEQYKSIHSSQTIEIPAFGVIVPEVKIFEYIGD